MKTKTLILASIISFFAILPGAVHAALYSGPTVNISANPASISMNGTSVITWNSSGAKYCFATFGINGWVGLRDLSGSFKTGEMKENTKFDIICANEEGKAANGSVTVNLSAVKITATPANISHGQSTVISWKSIDASYCTGTGGTYGWPGRKSTSGSFVTPAIYSTTTFDISCVKADGVVSRGSVTVSPIATLSMSAEPKIIPFGGTAIITWNSKGAASCKAKDGTSDWRGERKASGNFSTKLEKTTVFSLICTDGIEKEVSASATVEVIKTEKPDVTIQANPTFLYPGQSSLISWGSVNSTYCVGTSGNRGWSIDRKNTSGTFATDSISKSVTFGIYCLNELTNERSEERSVVIEAGTRSIPKSSVPAMDVSSADSCPITKILKRGMEDEQVKCLQKRLNAKGYQVQAPGYETTYFGDSTLTALKAFQAANSLYPTGVCNLSTIELLVK